jgi:hypothetical protein
MSSAVSWDYLRPERLCNFEAMAQILLKGI